MQTVYRHVYRHVHGHVYRHMYRHVYRHVHGHVYTYVMKEHRATHLQYMLNLTNTEVSRPLMARSMLPLKKGNMNDQWPLRPCAIA